MKLALLCLLLCSLTALFILMMTNQELLDQIQRLEYRQSACGVDIQAALKSGGLVIQ